MYGNSGGLLPPRTPPQNGLIVRWFQQGTGTHQLPSSMENVSRPLIPYPTTVWMHINLPSFLGLWPHLHKLVIPLFIFSSSTFLPACLHSPEFLNNFGR